MPWRMGRMTALVALLLVSGSGRAQQPLPFDPGSLPWAGPAAGVRPRPVDSPLPLVAPGAATNVDNQATEQLAPVVMRVSAPFGPRASGSSPQVVTTSTEVFREKSPTVALEPSEDWPEWDESEAAPVPDVSLVPIAAAAPSPISLETSTLPTRQTPDPDPAASIISPSATAPVGTPNAWAGVDAATAALLLKNQPDLVDRLYDQVLELEPNGDNRRAIERVRDIVKDTQVGVNETDDDWTAGASPGIRLGGRVHLDWLNWPNDADFGGQPNYVEFRRLRLSASGEGYGVMFYQLELEFSPEVDVRGTIDQVTGEVDVGEFGIEMKDAYLGIREIPVLGTVLFGHFFTPMGLELQTSSNYITFLERGLPRVFLPGREVGVAAYNHLANERLTWAFGIFFDEMNESAHAIIDDNQGTRLVGRVTGTPYYDELSEGRYLVHLGLGYTYTRPRLRREPPVPPALATYHRYVDFASRPEIHRGSSLITTGDIDTQQYHITNAEFAWVHGPLSIQSELTWTSLDEAAGGTTDLYGAYVFASYFLTGEHRQYDRVEGDFQRVTPYENFWFVRTPHGASTGWGAWEVACRWSYLDFSDVFDQQLNDLTVGLNWYWNPYTRMMFNWIHPFCINSQLSNAVPDAEGDILAMRLQFDF